MTFPFVIKYVFFTLRCINQPFKRGSRSEESLSETTDQNGAFLGGFSVLMLCWRKWCKLWEKPRKLHASRRCWERFNLHAAPAYSAVLLDAGGNMLE